MYRTVTNLKRFIHDTKLPSVKNVDYHPVFVKVRRLVLEGGLLKVKRYTLVQFKKVWLVH